MGLKPTKVPWDDKAKIGYGLYALQQLNTAYNFRYAPYSKRYTIHIYGQKYTGIGIEGLLKSIKQIAELGLKLMD